MRTGIFSRIRKLRLARVIRPNPAILSPPAPNSPVIDAIPCSCALIKPPAHKQNVLRTGNSRTRKSPCAQTSGSAHKEKFLRTNPSPCRTIRHLRTNKSSRANRQALRQIPGPAHKEKCLRTNQRLLRKRKSRVGDSPCPQPFFGISPERFQTLRQRFGHRRMRPRLHHQKSAERPLRARRAKASSIIVLTSCETSSKPPAAAYARYLRIGDAARGRQSRRSHNSIADSSQPVLMMVIET